jgi:uncharacterized protein (DUF952 family)
MQSKRLYHITTKTEADAAGASGNYAPRAFEREGFIHCSYIHQVGPVANRIFRGQTDLVVLEIDPALVNCHIVDENLEGGSELFPHIYGRLPLTAVLRTHDFRSDHAGHFTLPQSQ